MQTKGCTALGEQWGWGCPGCPDFLPATAPDRPWLWWQKQGRCALNADNWAGWESQHVLLAVPDRAGCPDCPCTHQTNLAFFRIWKIQLSCTLPWQSQLLSSVRKKTGDPHYSKGWARSRESFPAQLTKNGKEQITQIMTLSVFNGNVFKCVFYIVNISIRVFQEYREIICKH